MNEADDDGQAAPPGPAASPQVSTADAPAPDPAPVDSAPPQPNQPAADAPAPAGPNACVEPAESTPATTSPEDAGSGSPAAPPPEAGTDAPTTNGGGTPAGGSAQPNLTDEHYDWIHQMCGKNARGDGQAADGGSAPADDSGSGGMTGATPGGAGYSAPGTAPNTSDMPETPEQQAGQPKDDGAAVQNDSGAGGAPGEGSKDDESHGAEGHTGAGGTPPPPSEGGSEAIHTILTAAGFIPEVGAVANLANAGLYAAEGDYKEAGISAVMAVGDLVPEGGQVLGGIIKGGEAISDAEKAAKLAEGAEKAAKLAEEAEKAAKLAKEAKQAEKVAAEAKAAQDARAAAGTSPGDTPPPGSRSPSTPSMKDPAALLEPGGVPIGRPGASKGIRRLNGGLPAAEKMFDELAKGGRDVTPKRYPGKMVELPNGGRVGLRPVSSSRDRSPSIDVDIPGVNVEKMHFEP